MGESDKMSSDSVTNRECRAVPTPNVILLYDEHRDAVADAFAKYSRPYARFTFAVARLQQIFMLATRWKDPCILAYPWMKEIFRVAAHPFSPEDIRKGVESKNRGDRPQGGLHFCRDFVVIWQDICREVGGRPCRVTSGVDFKMMTFSTSSARHGVGGGASRRMPIGAPMSGFENPPPPARTP